MNFLVSMFARTTTSVIETGFTELDLHFSCARMALCLLAHGSNAVYSCLSTAQHSEVTRREREVPHIMPGSVYLKTSFKASVDGHLTLGATTYARTPPCEQSCSWRRCETASPTTIDHFSFAHLLYHHHHPPHPLNHSSIAIVALSKCLKGPAVAGRRQSTYQSSTPECRGQWTTSRQA